MDISIRDIPKVRIEGVRLSLVCESCGRTWGVWLITGTWSYPYRGDTCIACSEKRAAETKVRLNSLVNVNEADNVDNGQTS